MLGSTCSTRLAKATAICQRLETSRWSYAANQRIVTALILPMALYGSEAAPLSDAALGKLDSCIARVIGPSTQDSSTTMAFNVTAHRNLSAYAESLHRKVVLLRRIIVKHLKARQNVDHVLGLLTNCGFNGTACDRCTLQSLPVCPPPGQGGRDPWQPAGTPISGPISLLLQGLFEVAAGMDKSLVVHGDVTLRIDILNCPYQHLKPCMMLLSSAARTRHLQSSRKSFASLTSFDHHSYHAALKKLSVEDKAWINNVHVMAAWTPDKLAKVYEHC